MASKPYPLRISEKTTARIKKVAEAKDVPFATMCRLLMSERLDELGIKISETPAIASKPSQGRIPTVSIGGDAND